MLCNRPLVWEDEEKMNAKARELTEEELADHKKAFKDIEDSIAALNQKKKIYPAYFPKKT